MSRIKEEHRDLGSVMRSIIRAAGGFGEGVSLGGEYACRAASLWLDGKGDRLQELVPEWTRNIRQALRKGSRGGAPTPLPAAAPQAQTPQEPQEEQAPAVRIHQVQEQDTAATAGQQMYACHATAEANILAVSHASAMEKFMGHIHVFVKNASITIVKQE